MIVSCEVCKLYPMCAGYIRNFLYSPDEFEKRYPKVWGAFIKACTTEMGEKIAEKAKAAARRGLTLHMEPWIIVAAKNDELKARACGVYPDGRNPTFAGLYPGKNNLVIYPATFEAYEHGTGWMVLEGTILHELVHWVRCQVDLCHDVVDDLEIGQVFNNDAYGGLICVPDGEGGRLLQYGPTLSPTLSPKPVPKKR